jgi:hypothetical protein
MVRMSIVYAAVAVLLTVMLTASGMMKVRRDPRSTKIIHDLVGVPLEFFPILAACEFAGALGLLAGIIWPFLGVAASVGLVAYFVGATVGHVRVGDVKGLGPAVFMLFLSGACLILRVLSA